MKLGAAAGDHMTPISGLRSFTEASVAVQTLGHAASSAMACLVEVALCRELRHRPLRVQLGNAHAPL